MTKKNFNSPEELIQAVVESKQQYDAKRQSLSFEEKLKILVKLQEKAFFMGKIQTKPWPIK